MIKIIQGDLLDATENIIGHQVNCRAKMASGVAKEIRAKYPEVYGMYMTHSSSKSADMLLGDLQIVVVGEHKYVANLFGQRDYGYDGRQYTSYDALELALIKLVEQAKPHGLSVALPYKIGCDRGGGDWDGKVFPMLERVFADYELTLYRI